MKYLSTILLILVLCFIAYASLTPFVLRPPAQIFSDRNSFSLADNFPDVASNILLYIPLGFLLSICPVCKRLKAWVILIVSCFFGMIFSALLESIQAFIVCRYSQLIDVVNNTLGVLIGSLIGLWFRSVDITANIPEIDWRKERMNFILFTYVLSLFIFSLMPYDITIRPSALQYKLAHHGLELIPFHLIRNGQFRWEKEGFNLLAFLPLGFWVVLSWKDRMKGLAAVFFTVSNLALVISIMIELARLPVISAVSSVTNVIFALVAADLGALLAIFFLKSQVHHDGYAERKVLSSPFILILVLNVWIIFVVFLYPYDFTFTGEKLRNSLAHKMDWFLLGPYLNSQGFFGVWKDMSLRALCFIPFGLFTRAFLRYGLPKHEKSWIIFIGIISFITGVIIEGLQLFSTRRYSDVTDVFLYTSFSLIGGWLFNWCWSSGRSVPIRT